MGRDASDSSSPGPTTGDLGPFDPLLAARLEATLDDHLAALEGDD